VHTIKGSAGTLGASSLHEHAAVLEEAIRNQEQTDVANAYLDALARAFRSLSLAIAEKLN
jgi:HPt (histidine-containing phosphotransfer) domain-containing protein